MLDPDAIDPAGELKQYDDEYHGPLSRAENRDFGEAGSDRGARQGVSRRVNRARNAAIRIADIATGSGAIAITLAHELRSAIVVATDLSERAVALAERNAARNAVADRVEVRTGDLLAPFGPDEQFDIVVSNPPYIPSAHIAGLSVEVQCEPRSALDGGSDGLTVLRRLVADAAAHIRPGGLLVVEHGFDQAEAVAALIARAGAYRHLGLRRDLAGNPRVTFARKC